MDLIFIAMIFIAFHTAVQQDDYIPLIAVVVMVGIVRAGIWIQEWRENR